MQYTLKERLVAVLNEKKAHEMALERLTGRTMAAASGYGRHGASRTLNSMIGWLSSGGSPEDDSDLQGSTLRQRARDLDAGGGLARGATRTLTTNVIGTGLVPKPKIDRDALGISDEQAVEIENQIKREWELWSGSRTCDASGVNDFYTIQRLAFLSMLVSGDVIALPVYSREVTSPYMLHIRLIEADRLMTDGSNGESESKNLENGNRVIDGVEIDKSGKVVAYHIGSRHPLAQEDTAQLTTQRIEAFGKKTGLPNVLHVFVPERPEQRRGVPYIAPMIEQLKQLDRYMSSELAANIIAAMFTLFLTHTEDSSGFPLDDSVPEGDRINDDDSKIELGQGSVYDLKPGTEPKVVSAMRQNAVFGDFVDAIATQIGASMEIPKEVLLKTFNSSYSASRGSIMEFWRLVKAQRAYFNSLFNEPIYEMFLSEAVSLGRIKANGFFDDPIKRKAWLKCEWVGTSMGQLDPLKEINAAERRIALNISTEDREAQEINGSDWHSNVAQRKIEIDKRKEMNPQETAADIDADPGSDGGNEDEQ